MNYGGRLTPANVGRVTNGSCMVENVGTAVVISVISHSIPVIKCTSGLKSVILKFVVGGRRAMSDKAGNVSIDLDMVDNVGVAVGISTTSHSFPEKHSTSGL